MQRVVKGLLWGTMLVALPGVGLAQSDVSTQYGKVGGMNAGNAQACGIAKEQVAKLRERHKASIRKLFGEQAGFEANYDKAAAASEQKVVQAWKQGQYKPTPEVCKELKQQVQS
ncbi:MAG TPA: hypothetical protein VIP30_00440 [Stenotrophomonas sp.]